MDQAVILMITMVPDYGSISYFAYDPLTWKVTAMTGPNHRTSFYEYDDAGRLTSTRDFEGNIITKMDYGYARNLDLIITDSDGNNYFEPGENLTIKAGLLGLHPNLNLSNMYLSYGDGDGTILDTLTTKNKIYNSPGKYDVIFSATDDNGNTRRATSKIEVTYEPHDFLLTINEISDTEVEIEVSVLYGQADNYTWEGFYSLTNHAELEYFDPIMINTLSCLNSDCSKVNLQISDPGFYYVKAKGFRVGGVFGTNVGSSTSSIITSY